MCYSVINYKNLEKKNKVKTKLNNFLRANGKETYKKILINL